MGVGAVGAGSNSSAGSSSSNASQSSQSSLPCGKVRQLFEVRRQAHGGPHGGAGRDRGLPLAPLERGPGHGVRHGIVHHRTRAPALATRSNSNVNLSQTYHFGQHSRQPRGHSLDRDSHRREGDWAVRSHPQAQHRGPRRRQDYASDSESESDEASSASPPPYARSYAHDLRFQEDFRIINRLPNVGGQLLSQSQVAMAPPGRLSAGATAIPGRRPPAGAASNENAPPAARANVSRLPAPARKTIGGAGAAPTPAPAAPAKRVAPLRPSSGQRSTLTSPTAAAPTSVKAAGPAQPARAPPATSAAPKSNGVAAAAKSVVPASRVPSSPQRMAAAKAPTPRGAGASGGAAAARPEPRQDDGLVPCPICSRRFLPDRIAKHKEICNRSTHKKRKVFDPVAARVKGTEAEKYVRRAKNAPEPKVMKNSNWRRKHEDFIQTIRAAKQVQTHIASGGKLSDLPPPPPSDYSDYVPCPHCGRKFNQTAADRHIPKCATMLHNKPKPAGGGKLALGKGLAGRR